MLVAMNYVLFISIRQFTNLAWTQFLDCNTECRDKWKKVSQSVSPGSQHDDSERSVVEALLFRETFVDRDQHIEAPRHRLKQGTVIEIGPIHFRRGFNLVL